MALYEALPALVRLASGEERKYTRLTEDGEIDATNDPLKDEDAEEKMIKLLNYDVEARRYACLALGQIVLKEGDPAEAALKSPGILEALRDCLSVDDTETVFNAAFACNRFSVHEEALLPMGEIVLASLLDVLENCDDPDALGQAIAALRRLVFNSDNALRAVKGGILNLVGPLCSSTRSESDGQQGEGRR